MYKNFIWFDFETTDKEIETARAVRLYAKKISPAGDNIGELDLWINPTVPIKPEATEVNGITDDMVKDKPTFKELSKQIYDFFVGCDLGGYNVLGFDFLILSLEFERCGIDFSSEGIRFIDPLLFWKKYEPKKLVNALIRFCGRELTDAHNPDADVNATMDVWKIMFQLWGHCKSIDEIHAELTEGKVDPDGKLIKDENGKIVIKFGKYNDRFLYDIMKKDSQYIEWLLNKSDMSGAFKFHLRKLKKQFDETQK